LAECRRVLAPGGRLALSWWDMPARQRIQGLFREAIAALGIAPPPEVPQGHDTLRFSDAGRFLTLLREAGLEDAAVSEHRTTHLLPDADAIWEVGIGSMAVTAAAATAQDSATQARLRELFGAPEDWGRTLHGLLWTQASAMVGPFAGATTVTLALPCSYDVDVAAAKYLDALRDGAIPLELQFSGTVFAAAPDGRLQVTQIPSDCEASFALPVALWREAMARTFGDAPWLRLRRDVFDRLYEYRARNALGTWEATVEALLDD
jgi:hypothetical protein